MVQVGNTTMKPLDLADNIAHINNVLTKRYPGGWKNIRALHIKTETSIAIPIHISTGKFETILELRYPPYQIV